MDVQADLSIYWVQLLIVGIDVQLPWPSYVKWFILSSELKILCLTFSNFKAVFLLNGSWYMCIYKFQEKRVEGSWNLETIFGPNFPTGVGGGGGGA